MLSMNDTLESASKVLAQQGAGAEKVIAEICARCCEIDPHCESPLQYLVLVDRYRIPGPFLNSLYKDVCRSDVVLLLAVLRWTEMGRIRATDIRGSITRVNGGLTPPYFKGVIDPVYILSMLQAAHPTFREKH